MTDLLDRTIKTALGDIVAHTPNLGPTPTEFLVPLEAPSRRRPVALAAAAVLAVAGVAAIGAIAVRRDPAPNTTASTADTGPAPAPEELQPAATLPDTPPTWRTSR